ncbi:uncharacterized protein MCYG_08152 [Microsporum canis CBS 113480]|uniref:Uncharacterized protein n=1 Tax=Arthroderma otae (strain ATCC MYA-4605 / CBS 113480) TaxID=554155 RepID=C5FZN0_ARTOC|nr:uncharacterized protein MCYG_08152 [Microsporum canis CBS 113480]EEQ35333.1 predicted protein [Microsporum canis CBS 113480]
MAALVHPETPSPEVGAVFRRGLAIDVAGRASDHLDVGNRHDLERRSRRTVRPLESIQYTPPHSSTGSDSHGWHPSAPALTERMPAALFVPRETFDALDLACGRIQVRESGYGLVALQRRPPLPPGCPPYISTKKHKLTARLDEKTDPWKGVLTAYSVACRPESSRPRFHHIRVRARIRHGKMNEDLATADHDGFKTKTVTLHSTGDYTLYYYYVVFLHGILSWCVAFTVQFLA